MTTETDEQVLQSFLHDDESLASIVTIQAAQRGFTTTPPQLAEEATVGVTEQRLLWFDEGLETIDLSAINSVEVGSVEHQSAPTIVRVGSVVLLAGIVAGIVGWLFAGLSPTVGIGLATAGVVAFVASIGTARARGDTGGGFEKHRLSIQHDDGVALLWGSETELTTIESALDEQLS